MSSAQLTKLKRKATELEQKKQFEKALALYIQVIEEAGRDLDDADLQLYNRVGDLLMRQNNVSEGLSYYEKAVDMYAERGFLNNAIALCNKVLRQSPARTAVYYKLGKISARKGFKADARKNFLEYADRVQKTGDLDEAFRALKEFADLCPDQDDVRLMLADLLTREKRTGEALEQLEQLYAKLEAEGRAAEARATMDRIKAIDPEVTPRSSGTWNTQKSNDLVFLDVEDADFPLARSEAAAREPTPVVPLQTVESIDVSAVGALQGLTITFLPDDAPDGSGDGADQPPAVLEGLDATAHGDADDTGEFDFGALTGLVPQINDLAEELADAVPLPVVDHAEWSTPEEVVTPMDGLASVAVSLTGSHPSMGPLLEEPPLSGEEFGELLLPAEEPARAEPLHDLALPFNTPLLDDLHMPPASEAPAMPESLDLDEGSPDGAERLGIAFGAEDLLTDAEPELADLPLGAGDAGGAAASEAPTAEFGGATEVEQELADTMPDEAEIRAAAPSPDEHEAEDHAIAAAEARDEASAAGRFSDDASSDLLQEVGGDPGQEGLEGTGSAPVEASTIDVPVEEQGAPDESSDVQETSGGGASVDGDFAEGMGEGNVAPGPIEPVTSALDIEALRAEMGMESPSADGLGEPEAAEPATRSAFEEERVELPMMDLAASADAAEAAPPYEHQEGDDLEDLLAAPPSFGEGEEASGFEPAPLDLASGTSTDEWSKPEVLIDGEWRDEHVGDLVSGEIFVIGDRRPPHPPEERSTFDDLSAAMLYDGEGAESEGGDRADTHARGASDAGATRGSTLSFGGTEAQLRRRLELEPGNTALRRQLGEALLDVGEREEGLTELETAVLEYELRGDFPSARDVVDVILRIVPMSVRHHQKRVEYAVRASDRPRLVEAYTELADALFRCGEPDKAHVVYARVLELAPTNERARFALSMLADDAGDPRSSDEVPAIDTGILSGRGEMPLPPYPAPDEAVDDEDGPAVELPYMYVEPEPVVPDEPPEPAAARHGGQGPEPLEAIDPLDAEVEAAFSSDTPEARDARRRTGELAAIEEWAAANEVPLVPATPDEGRAPTPVVRGSDDDFVDLGDWLRGTEPERSTRMVAQDVAPTGDEDADFAEMLRRFKQGVAANVEDEDFASHYDLGVAFKEMGLIDEAIAQFQRALRGPDHRIRAYEALGQCFVEKGQHQLAMALLQRAADAGASDDQQLVGVLYLLGLACESLGRQRDAVGYYQRVFAVDIEFRDVARRLSALERDTT